jgi:hypothetical protein
MISTRRRASRILFEGLLVLACGPGQGSRYGFSYFTPPIWLKFALVKISPRTLDSNSETMFHDTFNCMTASFFGCLGRLLGVKGHANSAAECVG